MMNKGRQGRAYCPDLQRRVSGRAASQIDAERRIFCLFIGREDTGQAVPRGQPWVPHPVSETDRAERQPGRTASLRPVSTADGRRRALRSRWTVVRCQVPRGCRGPLGLVRRGRGETGNEAALPGRFHRARRVVAADVGDRLVAGQPVQDGEAGQRRSRPPVPAGAGDLHAPGPGAHPCLAQGAGGIRDRTAAGSPASGPSGPPRDRRWSAAQQVQPPPAAIATASTSLSGGMPARCRKKTATVRPASAVLAGTCTMRPRRSGCCRRSCPVGGKSHCGWARHRRPRSARNLSN